MEEDEESKKLKMKVAERREGVNTREKEEEES